MRCRYNAVDFSKIITIDSLKNACLLRIQTRIFFCYCSNISRVILDRVKTTPGCIFPTCNLRLCSNYFILRSFLLYRSHRQHCRRLTQQRPQKIVVCVLSNKQLLPTGQVTGCTLRLVRRGPQYMITGFSAIIEKKKPLSFSMTDIFNKI